jgi:hypothetical protein
LHAVFFFLLCISGLLSTQKKRTEPPHGLHPYSSIQSWPFAVPLPTASPGRAPESVCLLSPRRQTSERSIDPRERASECARAWKHRIGLLSVERERERERQGRNEALVWFDVS